MTEFVIRITLDGLE